MGIAGGSLQVASGATKRGDVQAFTQYSRQFTQPLAQLGSMANLLESGVASAERGFQLLVRRSSRRILLLWIGRPTAAVRSVGG